MRYTEKFDYEANTDDVCNSRQIIEKLLAEFDLNAVAGTEHEMQDYASCIKHYHDAIAALRQIEILLSV